MVIILTTDATLFVKEPDIQLERHGIICVFSLRFSFWSFSQELNVLSNYLQLASLSTIRPIDAVTSGL